MNLSQAIRFLAAVSVTLLVCCGTAGGATSPDLAPIVEDYRARIPGMMAEQGIPGLAVVLVADDGVVWNEGFGITDANGKAPVTPDTFFSLQSNSKAFTALTVLTAVQAGKLDLDTPIAAYLPDFTIRSRFGDHPETRITLRHLLSHTAGLAHEAPVGNNYRSDASSFEEHIQSISRTWLRYPVGERYAYSNLGIDLAGYIVEKVTGEPFADYAHNHFLAPVGMTDSSFAMEQIRRYPSRALGHDNYLARLQLEIPMIPAGGLYASAREMGAFLLFHLRQGRAGDADVLPAALLEQMYSVPFAMPGQKNGYGLGIYREQRHGTVSLSHSGGGYGFLSHMRWYPELGIGVAVLTNATGHSLHTTLGQNLLYAIIAERLLAKPAPPAAPPADWQPGESHLEKLAGSYVSERGFEWILLQRDGAFGILSGDTFYPLHFTSAGEAYERDGDNVIHYRFRFDAAGRPTAIVLVDEGLIFDRNTGPGDPPGSNRAGWEPFVGRYRILEHGTPVEMLTVERRNGFLFANNLILREQSPGVFTACTGDVLDLSGAAPTFRNIPMEKIVIPEGGLLAAWVCAAILLIAGGGTALDGLRRWFRRRRPEGLGEPARRSHRLADTVAWAAGVTALAVLGSMLFQYPMLIGYGLAWNPRFPVWMKVAYFMPMAAGVLALLTACFAVTAWREPAWPARRRFMYTAVALALLVCTGLFYHWKLLGL